MDMTLEYTSSREPQDSYALQQLGVLLNIRQTWHQTQDGTEFAYIQVA